MIATTLRALPWPLPALLAWTLCGALHAGLAASPATRPAAAAAALALGLCLAVLPPAWPLRRRAMLAAGWPVAALALQVSLPAWAWGVALALALLAYPLRAWRDAPLFPTPRGALDGLAAALPLPSGARVLDAGCGIGDGLLALHAQWPQARIEGVEQSRPWALWAALRCRGRAQVRRGDLWRDDWSACDVVYLFQRPETMPRAWDKAQRECRAGSWLVSLQFAIPGIEPTVALRADSAWPVWLYRIDQTTPAGTAETASTRRPRRR
ncbi:MAG: class I SAM-dependent methyltransferase [Aquabacterium sp.]